MTVQEISLKIVQVMINASYSPLTAWGCYSNELTQIVRIHEKQGYSELQTDIVAEFISTITQKYEKGVLGKSVFYRYRAGAERLLLFCETGNIQKPRHVSHARLNDYYDAVLYDFVENSNICKNPKTIATTASDLRQHFGWLIKNNVKTLKDVTAQIIRDYLIYCADKYQPATLIQYKHRLKHAYLFLADNDYVTDAFNDIFSFKVSLPKKIKLAASPDDVSTILTQVDRNTPSGKRAYAMFILSIITGLRAVDIARLKLTDINWRIGEIRVLQQKNGKPLALPLTTDVAIALKDYILNARLSPTRIMNSNYDEVFLSLKAPCKPLLNGSSIKYVYQQYRSKANLKSGSFHDLRRAVGKNMVTAGVSVDMTAQVLGITDLDTTKQYISLDSKHLKECALDFNGIAPKGGASA